MKQALLLSALAFALAFATQAKTYNTPYGFIENKGQIIDQNNNLNPAVKYLWTGKGMKVQLKDNSFSYEVLKAAHFKRVIPVVNPTSKKSVHGKPSMTDDSIVFYSHRIDVALLGANEYPEMITGTAGKEYLNYYTTGTPEEGIKTVHHYNKVTYQNVYPNIDLEFVLDGKSEHGFKYNFIVRPGGDVAAIQLQYQGADKTELTANGSLAIATAYGNVTEQIPTSYQQETGKEIKVNYTKTNNNVYGFDAGVYNPQQTLVIDPWCTYMGWGANAGLGVVTPGVPAIDASKNIITVGHTNMQNNIATSGAFQTVYGGGNYDVYMRKYNPSGYPIWCTYYGGIGEEKYSFIACNESGDFYIDCSTDISSNLGTTGALYPTLASVVDSSGEISFLAKFNTSGFRIWSTYYPATVGPVVLDHQGNILYCSWEAGGSGCTTPGAFQTLPNGLGDLCIVKFNPNGTRLWGTFYGGNDYETCPSITVDNSDNVIVSGITYSMNNIATTGSFQTSYGSNNGGDCFIVKFNSSGQRLWGTYYGTESHWTTFVAVDGNNDIYLSSITKDQSGFYATPGAFQLSLNGTGMYDDYFLAKISSNGQQRLWGTYFGGSLDEAVYSLQIDNHDNILFCGSTASQDTIGTINGNHPNYSGSGDGFIEKFNQSGVRVWGTYFGGTGVDDIEGMVLDNNGNIVITGTTESDTGVATQGTYCDTLINGGDGYLAFLDSNGKFSITGIGELFPPSSSIIKVYPNPAKDKIIVSIKEFAGKGGSISLQSIEGKLLKQLSVKTETTSVDMSGLPSGTYLLQYDDGEVCETVKVVKE